MQVQYLESTFICSVFHEMTWPRTFYLPVTCPVNMGHINQQIAVIPAHSFRILS